MTFGPITVFNATIASGGTSGSTQKLPEFNKVYLVVPSMSTATGMDVYGSVDGTSYYQVLERVNTAPVQYQTLSVASGLGTNGAIVPLDTVYPYIKFIASAAVSGGVALKLICS